MFKAKKLTGALGHGRLIIKGFNTSEALHKFLNSQYDNQWSESKCDLKPGTYATIGGKMVNIKDIDPSVLPHV